LSRSCRSLDEQEASVAQRAFGAVEARTTSSGSKTTTRGSSDGSAASSTNWVGATANESSNWESADVSAGIILLETGDYILLENGSDTLGLQ